MAVSGVGNNYHPMYQNTYASQKSEAARKTEERGVETKNAGDETVSDYASYLQKKYDCVKDGSVTISGTYLKECAKNPEKAKELEKNLAFFKEGYESGLKNARANAKAIGARLVNYSESWSIDSTGNVTMMASTTVTSDGSIKGWRELKEEQEERLKEKKEKEEKVKEQKEAKEEQEITIKQVEAESEVEAKAMMQQRNPSEFYYSEFDIHI